MKSTKGFTLIELLVVIAIIALLASIVLASLASASNMAADNSVKAAMRELSTQIQSDTSNGYFGSGLTLPWAVSSAVSPYCSTWPLFSDTRIQQILTNIVQNAASTGFHCAVDTTGTKWAVSISLLKGSGTPWCIDNSGHFEGQGVIISGTITGTCP